MFFERMTLASLCGKGFCILAGTGMGLLTARIWSTVIGQADTLAAQETRMGLAILSLAGLLIIYQVQSSCGLWHAARRFYHWLGEGDVAVDG